VKCKVWGVRCATSHPTPPHSHLTFSYFLGGLFRSAVFTLWVKMATSWWLSANAFSTMGLSGCMPEPLIILKFTQVSLNSLSTILILW
jgi:hypothetical protein